MSCKIDGLIYESLFFDHATDNNPLGQEFLFWEKWFLCDTGNLVRNICRLNEMPSGLNDHLSYSNTYIKQIHFESVC